MRGHTAFGSLVLRINPVLLLGAIAGSMTSGAALAIVNRDAGNPLPSLGSGECHGASEQGGGYAAARGLNPP